jgi:branched-chain amino acid transport system substrate-binding protein
MSGTSPNLAAGEEQSGINAWVGWVNNHGGIDGHPVKVIVKDDKGIPTVAVSAAKTLIQDDHVLGIVSLFSAGTPSMANVLQTSNVALVAGEPIFLGVPNFFPTSGTVDNLNVGFATLTKQLGAHTLGWVTSNASTAASVGTQTAHKAATAAGLGFYSAALPNAVPSYTPTCLDLKQHTVDAVWTIFLPRIAGDCTAQNYSPKWETVIVGGNDNVVQPLVSDTAKAKYSVFSLQWAFPWFLNTPALNDFHQAVSQYGGGIAAGPTTAETWQGLTVAQYALSKLGPNPTSSDFLNALYTIKNQSIGGVTVPLTYTQGAKIQEVPCFFTTEVSDGQLSAPRSMSPVCAPTS